MNNDIFLMQINGLLVRIPQFLCQILALNTNRNMQLQQIEEQLSNPLTLQRLHERWCATEIDRAVLEEQLRTFQQNYFNNWENVDWQTRNSQIIFVSENLSNILGIARIPVELSVQERSHFIMSRLLENANNDVDGGYIPLHIAILEGNVPLTQLLLQCDASNVNFQTPNNETSLHLATRINNIRLTELLLANGANVDVQDNRLLAKLI